MPEAELSDRLQVVQPGLLHLAIISYQVTWKLCMRNVQGILVSEVMERCNLSVVSAGSLSSAPSFTYLSDDVRTTVDYILADVEATSLMSDCFILPMDDLNTSDHLPLLVDMMYAPCQEEHMKGAVSQRIDWDQAR